MDVSRSRRARCAGMIVSVTAGVEHYAMAKTAAIIEVSGIAPDTTLVGK